MRVSLHRLRFLLAASLVWALPIVAYADDEPEWNGTVQRVPSGGLVGAWDIGGRNIATEIESEQPRKCPGGGSNGARGGRSDMLAFVERMPNGLVGDWTIGGVVYRTDTSTSFSTDGGAFRVGSCVKVTFVAASSGNQALKITTRSSQNCASRRS